MSTSPECGRSFVRVPSAKSAKSPDTVLLISAPESSLRQTASSPLTQLNANVITSQGMSRPTARATHLASAMDFGHGRAARTCFNDTRALYRRPRAWADERTIILPL